MRVMSYDIETSCLDPFKGIIVSHQWKEKQPQYIDIYELMNAEHECLSEYAAGENYILNKLRDPSVKVILHNAKFEWEWIYVKYGIEITNFEDTLLLSFMLDRGVPFEYTGSATIDNPRKLKSVKLKALAKYYLNANTEEDDFFEMAGTKKDPGILRAVRTLFLGQDFKEQFKGKGKALEKFGVHNKEILRERFVSYAKKDVEFTLALWEQLKEFADMEAYRNALKAIPHMIKMKHRGMHGDKKLLQGLHKKELDTKLEMEQLIYQLAGKTFNINSPIELPAILEKRNIKLPETAKGRKSTKKEVLLTIDDPLVHALLKYRKATKTGGTFLTGLLEDMGDGDILHPNYNMCGTVHGRYSSSDGDDTV